MFHFERCLSHFPSSPSTLYIFCFFCLSICLWFFNLHSVISLENIFLTIILYHIFHPLKYVLFLLNIQIFLFRKLSSFRFLVVFFTLSFFSVRTQIKHMSDHCLCFHFTFFIYFILLFAYSLCFLCDSLIPFILLTSSIYSLIYF